MKETWGRLLGKSQEVTQDNLPREKAAWRDGQLILLELVQPNPYQPRRNFDPVKIDELAQSIKTYGLLQPIIVRRHNNLYQIVAGERRYRACRKLGWSRMQALVREYPDSSMATIALIENLQREDLDFLEEAAAYEKLMCSFGLTQEVLAQRLGKSQSAIANKTRLLKLSEKIKKIFKESSLTERHARALLKISEEVQQLEIIKEVLDKELNVKQTEILVEKLLDKNKPGSRAKFSKGVVRDLRIFLNTLRQAIRAIEEAGLDLKVVERDCGEYYEVKIWLPVQGNKVKRPRGEETKRGARRTS